MGWHNIIKQLEGILESNL